MNAAELLTRIEKLPGEWKHPDPLGGDASHVLDLHLRHIAERLARANVTIIRRFSVERWLAFDRYDEGVAAADTYAECLISAAEGVCK